MSEAEAKSLMQQILESGDINASQIQQLDQQLNSDWVVDQDEIESLFKINQAIGGKDEDCPEWTEFFVRNVTRLVVMDLYTPGEIDPSEGDWLGGVLEAYRVNNETESKLVHEIKETTTSIAGKLGEMI